MHRVFVFVFSVLQQSLLLLGHKIFFFSLKEVLFSSDLECPQMVPLILDGTVSANGLSPWDRSSDRHGHVLCGAEKPELPWAW